MYYEELDALERIAFLEFVRKTDEHKWAYSTMDEGTRKFYQSFKEEGV